MEIQVASQGKVAALLATALAAMSLLLAGCGSSSSSKTTASHTTVTTTQTKTTATAPSKAKRTPSKAEALAYASAVNLRSGDLPGFTEEKKEAKHESRSEHDLTRGLARCTGAPIGEKGIAEASSPTFARKPSQLESQSIQSTVTVARTEAIASRELSVVRSERTGACIGRYLRLVLSESMSNEARIRGLSVSRIAAPADSFGWRMVATLAIHGVSLPVRLELLGFVQGRAEVSFDVMALPEPFPAATERRVVSQLIGRAKSHEL